MSSILFKSKLGEYFIEYRNINFPMVAVLLYGKKGSDCNQKEVNVRILTMNRIKLFSRINQT